MSGFLIIFLIIWLLSPANKSGRRNDSARTILKVLGILFGISMVSLVLDVFGGGLIPLAIALFFFARYLQKEKIGASYDNTQTKEADYREIGSSGNWAGKGRETYKTSGSQKNKAPTGSAPAGNGYPGSNYGSINIPYPKGKRRNIVKKFNNEYNLTLTDEEISVIVDASYLSDSWKKEIADMNRRYESVYEWLTGDTAPIRVYLHAFKLQSISSDFTRQWQITETAFDEVFTYADSLKGMSYEQRLTKVNEHFFTTFTDASFMIAYRFMQYRGHNYDIGSTYIPRDHDPDLAERMAKYDYMEEPAGQAQAAGSVPDGSYRSSSGSISRRKTFGSDLDSAASTADTIDDELKKAMSRYDEN